MTAVIILIPLSDCVTPLKSFSEVEKYFPSTPILQEILRNVFLGTCGTLILSGLYISQFTTRGKHLDTHTNALELCSDIMWFLSFLEPNGIGLIFLFFLCEQDLNPLYWTVVIQCCQYSDYILHFRHPHILQRSWQCRTYFWMVRAKWLNERTFQSSPHF